MYFTHKKREEGNETSCYHHEKAHERDHKKAYEKAHEKGHEEKTHSSFRRIWEDHGETVGMIYPDPPKSIAHEWKTICQRSLTIQGCFQIAERIEREFNDKEELSRKPDRILIWQKKEAWQKRHDLVSTPDTPDTLDNKCLIL